MSRGVDVDITPLRRFGPALLVLFFAVALYAVSVLGTYVYDDVARIPKDPRVSDVSLWGLFLTESYNDAVDNLYRPLTSFSYAVQGVTTGTGKGWSGAYWFHLVNVLLYGVVCAQVATLGGRLARDRREAEPGAAAPASGEDERASDEGIGEVSTGGRAAARVRWPVAIIALVAGVLFAVHPVHGEVVATVVGRAELICAIGMLGALLVITHPERHLTPRRCVAAVALMFVSIGGKEQGLVLPGLFLAWFALPSHPPRSRGRRERLTSVGSSEASAPSDTAPTRTDPVDTTSEAPASASPDRAPGAPTLSYASHATAGGMRPTTLLALLVVFPLAGYLLWRESILPMAWPRELLDETIQTMRDVGGLDRVLMPVALLGRSLQLLVVPWSLSLDYGAEVIMPPQSWSDPFLWLGFVTLVLWGVALNHALRHRWRPGAFCLIGLALTYLPASNGPTIIGTIYGERLLFLPSAFFVLYGVLLAARWRLAWQVALPIAAVLVVAGAARTYTYIDGFNDRLTLYREQAQSQPRSLRLWMLYAEEARERGLLDEAAEASARATQFSPDYWSHWVQRARIEADRGNLEAALGFADRAVQSRTFGLTVTVRDEIAQRMRARGATTRPATRDAVP